MQALPHLMTDAQRDALNAGIGAVEQIEVALQQLEYLKAMHLASLARLASQIARDEGHADHGELVHRAVEAEVAAATRTGQTAAAHRMSHADRLFDRYAQTAAAFSEGRLSLRHTQVIEEAGRIIADVQACAAYEREVLPLALELTARQLRAHALRLAERFAERDIDQRHRDARQRRGVRIVPLEDGMAELCATIGAVEAYAIKDRLARIARRTLSADHGAATATATGTGTGAGTGAGVSVGTGAGVGIGAGHAATPEHTAGPAAPTLQQAQADVLTELLLAGSADGAGEPASGIGDPLGAISGRVQVSVPVLTLIGDDSCDNAAFSDPAELAGYGPIDSETARRLAGGTLAWERVLTHPVSGLVLTVDRYRPSEDLRRLLGARDQRCRFPGCTRRLDHCDIDHTVAAAQGGPTELGNLAHLCRKHHTLKHFEMLGGRGWKPRQRPGGVLEWRSPTGRRYVDAPIACSVQRVT
ncbi:HNH endonuclease signature motif containing protein [Leucobacter tenebrionis]|uniref:HNH endonuclease signature motif containing protein n=1 Tax=Leucobacter tenebrionis TaxID=2873270 RepID=UPI001CA6BFEB|nr:HNH endonuclease signature motif containing protein [Leucobacter tenebrionis]QZY52304.1 HNH endonuclease [Leucobacter tenebrionis]